MATALLAYEAKVATNQRQGLSIEQLLGDGSNGAADHALKLGEMIEAIDLAPPVAGERAAYKRAISRAYAEWPLVEVARARGRRAGRVPVRAPDGGRGRARADPARRGREGLAGRTCFGVDYRGGGARRDRGLEALADDRL